MMDINREFKKKLAAKLDAEEQRLKRIEIGKQTINDAIEVLTDHVDELKKFLPSLKLEVKDGDNAIISTDKMNGGVWDMWATRAFSIAIHGKYDSSGDRDGNTRGVGEAANFCFSYGENNYDIESIMSILMDWMIRNHKDILLK